jgi:adenylosuccinate synthase
MNALQVEYKDRLYIGNVHLVCPHHKALDLIGSWAAPNKSTLQGMAPVSATMPPPPCAVCHRF